MSRADALRYMDQQPVSFITVINTLCLLAGIDNWAIREQCERGAHRIYVNTAPNTALEEAMSAMAARTYDYTPRLGSTLTDNPDGYCLVVFPTTTTTQEDVINAGPTVLIHILRKIITSSESKAA